MGLCSRVVSAAHRGHGTRIPSQSRYALSAAGSHRNVSGLPQQLDLLERYRGLVVMGRVTYDEEQVRVIAQLRRLQRELEGYAPPALASRYLHHSIPPVDHERNEDAQPWWQPAETFESTAESDIEARTSQGALVRTLTHAEEIAMLTTPKGLLLTGPPGSGKSFLIDLWYAAMPTSYKTRKHYSELVLEIYRAVWEETRVRMATVKSANSSASEEEEYSDSTPWTRSLRDRWRGLLERGRLPTRWVRTASRLGASIGHQPPIAFVVAQRLILRHWLLVFDEVQLLDVSSATLLADVLSWFWRMGGVVVGSSNKVPDDLYKNGVQRERLEPFVEALKARCPIVLMRSDKDWRAERAHRKGQGMSWYVSGQEAEFERRLASLVDPNTEQQPMDLVVFSRRICVPWSKGGVCRFTFAQLCEESLGPADYITLASTYHTVAITDIPVLKLSDKNQARRFISLIDALYEARCRIVCLAETKPEGLFFPDAPSAMSGTDSGSLHSHDVDVMLAEAVAETRDVYRPNVSSYDTPNMAEAPEAPVSALALDTLSIFSGRDEQFAFKRALSRLLEMTSESYAREETWTPLPADSRKWERPITGTESAFAGTSYGHAATHWESPRGTIGSSASVGEATDERISAQSSGRPDAPRLSEAHIWGVREDWGEHAKEWGQGAKAYENLERTHDDRNEKS